MSLKQFRLDTKSAGAQALEGLWGPGPPGDLLYDMSAKGRGRGNHATRTGAGPRSQYDEVRGHSLLFNGVDDVWSTERALQVDAGAFTMTAWVWLDSTTLQVNAAVCGSGDFHAAEWMFRISGSNGAAAALQGYGALGNISAAAVAGTFHGLKDSWAHVAFSRTTGGVANIYQNGLFVGTDATAADNLNTAKVLQIGCADSAANRWWQGMIDDVRHYSRALSLGEISHIYERTRYHPYADIVLEPIRRHGRHHWGHVRKVKS